MLIRNDQVIIYIFDHMLLRSKILTEINSNLSKARAVSSMDNDYSIN